MQKEKDKNHLELIARLKEAVKLVEERGYNEGLISLSSKREFGDPDEIDAGTSIAINHSYNSATNKSLEMLCLFARQIAENDEAAFILAMKDLFRSALTIYTAVNNLHKQKDIKDVFAALGVSFSDRWFERLDLIKQVYGMTPPNVRPKTLN